MALIAHLVDDDDALVQPRPASSDAQGVAATESLDRATPVVFVGTYGPRRCGIATFTADLAAAVAGERRVTPMVVAVTDPSGQYEYPAEVKFEIQQDVRADYARAAEFVNHSGAQLVSVQHEYGIFGGDDGGHILDFIRALRVPVIVTLHTVLKSPSANHAAIVHRMLDHGVQLVVMSEVARDLLVRSYGVGPERVRIIPHGIPVMDLSPDQDALKTLLGVGRRRLLLTFGLLSPNKGIETVIRALPAVVRSFPDLIYFVVGATHPVVLRREGEAYREMLEREAEKLGVREHVAFRPQFVSAAELRRYLQAADIFVSPYLNEAQVTSGALSYAMGAGAAVVSTPYWHAQELLADGRGHLFPFRDHVALGQRLLDLCGSPEQLRVVRDAAFAFTRSMEWPRIGDAYFELLRTALQESSGSRAAVGRTSSVARPLPRLNLDHLQRLTDDTGIIQHATYSVPARRTGYCVDDNARALIVAVLADRLEASVPARVLVTKYLSYLNCSQEADGTFRNFMSYGRSLEAAPPSEDCVGRALWALGVTATLAADEGCRALARDMFARALPHAEKLGPRGTAQAVLGLVSALAVAPDSVQMRGMLDRLVEKLAERYRNHATAEWCWFESTLTYDNAILPLALFAAYDVSGDPATLRVARESLGFLEGVCFSGSRLQLVGNTGWHSRGGEKSSADEQAIDASAFVLAFYQAYEVTGDRHYLRRMSESFAWFLGANRLGVPLYDAATGGCCDGMGFAHVNRNQGAESTICFLLSLLKGLEFERGENASLMAESA